MSAHFESGFFAGEAAWHGFGTVVPENIPWAQAIKLAGLDWEVGLSPLFAVLDSGKRVSTSAYGVVRGQDDRVLGVVGDRYTPIQNAEAFGVFERLFGDEARLHTAGSLKGGQVIWGLAELKETEIAGDRYRRFLLVTTAHDGSGALLAIPTNTRVVCWNTLSAAKAVGRKEVGFKVRHTQSAPTALAAKTDELGVALGIFDDFAIRAARLADITVTDGDLVDLCREFTVCKPYRDLGTAEFITQGPAADILQLSYLGTGNAAYGGTLYGLLQGVTEYVDHHSRGARRSREESRFAYILTGSGADHKAQAFQVLDAYGRTSKAA